MPRNTFTSECENKKRSQTGAIEIHTLLFPFQVILTLSSKGVALKRADFVEVITGIKPILLSSLILRRHRSPKHGYLRQSMSDQKIHKWTRSTSAIDNSQSNWLNEGSNRSNLNQNRCRNSRIGPFSIVSLFYSIVVLFLISGFQRATI